MGLLLAIKLNTSNNDIFFAILRLNLMMIMIIAVIMIIIAVVMIVPILAMRIVLILLFLSLLAVLVALFKITQLPFDCPCSCPYHSLQFDFFRPLNPEPQTLHKSSRPLKGPQQHFLIAVVPKCPL